MDPRRAVLVLVDSVLTFVLDFIIPWPGHLDLI